MGAQLQGGSGQGNGRRRPHNPMSEINVTPFVDVMLVLLVVFMITAPLLTAGVTVDLPETEAGAITKQDNTPVEISIGKDGKIHLGETEVKSKRLKALLKTIADTNKDRQVYLRADKSLAYGDVIKIMALVNQAGLLHVSLISEPVQRKKGR